MALLKTIKNICEAVAPEYSFEFETQRMMNERADDKPFPCIFFEEYYDGRYAKRYAWEKTATIELHFMKLCEMQNDAVERERLREDIEAEAVLPVIKAISENSLFKEVADFTCVPEPPLFDANAVSLLVRVAVSYNPCAMVDVPDYTMPTKVADFLYWMKYDDIDYRYAMRHFERGAMPSMGMCSALVANGMVARNYDWFDGYQATFAVRTQGTHGRHTVLGVASMASLTVQKADTGVDYDDYKLLPFMLLDGGNEAGLVCEMNVTPYGGFVKTSPERERYRVSAVMLVRWILDHYTTVDEAIEDLQQHVQVYQPQALTDMGYELHYLIADANGNSKVIEFHDGEIVARNSQINTNFRLHGVAFLPGGYVPTNYDASDYVFPTEYGVEKHGSGLERWNILNQYTAAALTRKEIEDVMDLVRFSQAYTKPVGNDFWWSEFVGLSADRTKDITVDTRTDDPDFIARVERYKAMWDNHEKGDGQAWITAHASVYSLAERAMYVRVQERSDGWRFALDAEPQAETYPQ